ncbi:MAG: hypothetical protein ACYTHK_04940 [Planctomycetota bacterium]|jgi:hypothetical protein
MKSLVFSLACLLVVACGSSKKETKQPEAAQVATDSTAAPLQAIYEIREQDGGKKVGMVYKRDHGEGRSIYWVYDNKGDRRGFVTPDNRAFAYEYVLDKRSDKANFIGSDTITASSRKIIGHDRAVRLAEISIDTWAGSSE